MPSGKKAEWSHQLIRLLAKAHLWSPSNSIRKGLYKGGTEPHVHSVAILCTVKFLEKINTRQPLFVQLIFHMLRYNTPQLHKNYYEA